MIADLAVEVTELTKSFGSTPAVEDLSFSISRGETFALLGPNGAGKTTTLEIIEGFRRADAGQVRVLGLDPRADGTRLRERIGVMLQEPGFYLTMTPREALRLFARFYPRPRDHDELVSLVGLNDVADTRFRRLSGGEKQRLNLALALLPRPEVLFLDEPTAGMDPQGRRDTWELMNALKTDGATIVLTTHYLDEAERLADRVAIINAGRLIALDQPSALVGAATTVRLRTAEPIEPTVLAALPSVEAVTARSGEFELATNDAPAALAEVAIALRERAVLIRELRVGQGTLEEVYLRLTGGRNP